ncbi:hypothetical protein HYT25_04070 [Candidatus Pacearchaeota archaeon]|nr:hypothetical protein [Candidatus Pacearchaeota archaeon]
MLNIKNIIFGFAIFILTIFVGIYGLSTLYGEAPEYGDYCPENLFNQSVCESEGGVWVENTRLVTDERDGIKAVPVSGGYCQYDYTPCQKDFENAEKVYFKKIFLTALPLGILIVLAGALIPVLESVSAGLMLGGVGMIVYGTGTYWRFTDDWMKFVLSLAGLIILIYAAYWFNKKEKGFWKRLFRGK